jgi:DNA-binding transcriptional LysR family regulator
MDIARCLETFCTVIECGSFTLAARKLYLTQPSVSTHIKELEKHYKSVLLNRKRDGIVPTDTGKLLYRYAKEIIKLIRKTSDAIDEVVNLKRGDIEIGASTVPGTYILPEILMKFKKKFPSIELSLKIKDTLLIVNDVYAQNFEFGIVGDRIKKQGLIFHKLIKDRIVFITPSGKNKTHLSFLEIKSIPLIIREVNSGTRLAVVHSLEKKGLALKDLNIVMELGSNEAIKHGVIASLGSSFVSERTIKNEVKQGLLKKVPVKGLSIERNFWIVRKTSSPLSRAAKALFDFIRNECT